MFSSAVTPGAIYITKQKIKACTKGYFRHERALTIAGRICILLPLHYDYWLLFCNWNFSRGYGSASVVVSFAWLNVNSRSSEFIDVTFMRNAYFAHKEVNSLQRNSRQNSNMVALFLLFFNEFYPSFPQRQFIEVKC